MAPHLVIQGKPDNINNNYQIIFGTLAADMFGLNFIFLLIKRKTTHR